MNKKDLRQFIRMQKGQFSPAQLEELSLPVIKRLLAHPRIKQAQVILMYYSLDDEVNTHEVINELVKQGKTVLLPAVVDDEQMELREYHGQQDLESGFFHLMEPVGKVFTDYDTIDRKPEPDGILHPEPDDGRAVTGTRFSRRSSISNF